jgi:hypothetical protein
MLCFSKKNNLSIKSIGFIYLIPLLILIGSFTFAHGPKGHGSSEFTAFMAVKKGVELYNQLLASGRLDESWETGLDKIEVATRKSGDKNEFVLGFSRSQGSPKTVYIFFSEKGEYTGSNFTAK